MRTKSKKHWKQQLKNMALSVTIVFACCFVVSFYPRFKSASYVDVSSFVNTTVEYSNGKRLTFQGVEFGPINKGDRITMQLSLPDDSKIDPATLTFGVNHAVTKVFFHDRLLASYGEDIAARGDLICHHKFFVEIPEEAWGQTITISLLATENRAFNSIAQFWLYPTAKAYYYYFNLEFGRMLVALSVLIISLITLFAIPLLVRQDKKRCLQLLFIALFGITSGMWMVLAEGLQQFFGIKSYLLTTFEFVDLVAQMIPLGGYILLEEKNERKKKLLMLLLAADTVFVALICVLNYCNIAHFPATVSLSIAVILVNGAVYAWNSLRNMDFSVVSKRISLLGVSVLGFAGIYDVVRFSLYRFTGLASFNQMQKTFPLGVLIFYVFLLVSAIISSRERQEQEQHNRAKLLASQIQPHFLYNTLASIREIIFEDPQCAADTLKSFTTYLRGAVRAMSDVQVVPFSEELKNIKAYAEIEKIRMPNRLHVYYQIEEADFVVPPFSIQPLVENAIRHGIYRRGNNGGSVTVHSYIQKNQWIIEISDTGVGFDVQAAMLEIDDRSSDSEGLKNLISRLHDITCASVSIQSVPEVGTTVKVVIPQKRNMELNMNEAS